MLLLSGISSILMNTLIIWLFFLGFPLISVHAQELADLRWQYRILLLMDPGKSASCDSQLQSLGNHRAALQARDVLIFVYREGKLLDEKLQATNIGSRGVPYPTFEGVVLIGLDGEVKMRKPFPVSPENILARIDAMPMRQAKIRDDR